MVVLFSYIGFYFIIINRDVYILNHIDLVYLSLYLINEGIYFVFFNLSFLNVEGVQVFWKIATISRIFRLSFLGSIQAYVLLKKWYRFLPVFMYSCLGGIITSYLLLDNPFQKIDLGYTNAFILNDPLFFIFISFFNLVAFSSLFIVQLKGNSNISFKKIKFLMNLIIANLLVNITIYMLFLLNPRSIFFRILYSVVFLTFLFSGIIIMLKKFDLFIVVTNKIYDFIIFHRSGVLLFSYNLAKGKKIEESVLKGSILIGINHILANFADQRDILNLIKMKQKDIIFEYNNEYGYALLAIVNHKSKVLEKTFQSFMQKFTEENKRVLNKISKNSRLIDVSEFENTKSIIEEYFRAFIS